MKGSYMVNPIESLSFSIQANPGVYALLLGSGISRPAGIPTGWEITLDLVERLAAIQEEVCEPGPAEWFQRKFGQPPNYSAILDKLARTRTERQQLLRPYFEANEQEREQGLKQPTAAHHAIAQLAAQGYVKVIITTNFDRLTESALREAGVEPAILSSQDDLKGALPLSHIQRCVFKVHGDYLDTRIRNTPDELDEYPEEFNRFLDRVFDEFGLIVCGWSASWDGALRDAIRRIQSRRFTTYWATRGDPSDEAQRLIENRLAESVHIEDADSFFQKVQHNVEAIEEFQKPHPLSAEASVARFKRFLPESKYWIQLEDLIDETVKRVIERTTTTAYDAYQLYPNTNTFEMVTHAHEATCSTLIAMAMVGGRWAEVEHCDFWKPALQRLAMIPRSPVQEEWSDLRRYPATLVLYALGLGAVYANRLGFLGCLYAMTVRRQNNEKNKVTQYLAPSLYPDSDSHTMQMLEDVAEPYSLLPRLLFEAMKRHTKRIIYDVGLYLLNFDKLEILISLNTFVHSTPEETWLRSTGDFMYRYGTCWEQILPEIEGSILNLRDESPYVKANLFGSGAENCWYNLFAWYKWLSKFSYLGQSAFSAHPLWGKQYKRTDEFGDIRVGDYNQFID